MDQYINNFNQELIMLINKYAEHLPSGVIYFILLSSLKDVNMVYQQTITEQQNNIQLHSDSISMSVDEEDILSINEKNDEIKEEMANESE